MSQLVRAGVEEAHATTAAYPILMMLHGFVMHGLLNKRQSAIRRVIRAACLQACQTLLDDARRKAR